MIVNGTGSNAVWIEGGILCAYSAHNDSTERIPLPQAAFTAIFQAADNLFCVLQRSSSDDVEISLRNYSEPAIAVLTAASSLTPSSDSRIAIQFYGDLKYLFAAPRAYIIYPSNKADKRRLLLIHGQEDDNFQELPWHDHDYDPTYQGIVSVIEIPNRSQLIIGIQRDSHPLVYDPLHKNIVERLELADRRGNPDFIVRPSANEIWATDYDTMVKLDSKTLARKATALVQRAIPPMEKLFIGKFHFDVLGALCFVSRPFSGDILALDADSMKEKRSYEIGGAPLEAAVLSNGTIVARQWKTNEVLIYRNNT